MNRIEVNTDAVLAHIDEIAKISISEGPGVTRRSFSPEERQAMEYFMTQAQDLDMHTQYDAIGNAYMWVEGSTNRFVAMTSHLDSVRGGGNYDGVYGIASGFETLKLLSRLGSLEKGVAVIVAAGEEGDHFVKPLKGSQAMFGQLPEVLVNQPLNKTDNTSLGDYLTHLGLDPQVIKNKTSTLPDQFVNTLDAVVEAHIEQGPVLDDAKIPIGVVGAIAGSYRQVLEFRGKASHSGATPWNNRQDALAASNELGYRLEELARSINDSSDGVLLFTPSQTHSDNGVSTISDYATASFDVRFSSGGLLNRFRTGYEALVQEISSRRNVSIDHKGGPSLSPAAENLSTDIQQSIRDASTQLGYDYVDLVSGAGHDAQTFANQNIPTGMIFVRNQHYSHNPDEAARHEDLRAGAQVLANTMYRLATR